MTTTMAMTKTATTRASAARMRATEEKKGKGGEAAGKGQTVGTVGMRWSSDVLLRGGGAGEGAAGVRLADSCDAGRGAEQCRGKPLLTFRPHGQIGKPCIQAATPACCEHRLPPCSMHAARLL